MIEGLGKNRSNINQNKILMNSSFDSSNDCSSLI